MRIIPVFMMQTVTICLCIVMIRRRFHRVLCLLINPQALCLRNRRQAVAILMSLYLRLSLIFRQVSRFVYSRCICCVRVRVFRARAHTLKRKLSEPFLGARTDRLLSARLLSRNSTQNMESMLVTRSLLNNYIYILFALSVKHLRFICRVKNNLQPVGMYGLHTVRT